MKKVPTRIWPLAGISILIVIVLYFVLKVPDAEIVPQVISDLIAEDPLTISDVLYSKDYDDGEGKWELKAREARVINKTEDIVLKDVLFKLDSPGNSFTLKSNQGSYCRKSGEIFLKGDVVGRSDKGYQIETNLLLFKQENRSVETDEHVRLTGSSFQIRGNGIYVDLKKEKVSIKNNVSTILSEDFLSE